MRQLTVALLLAWGVLAQAGTASAHSEESAVSLRTYTGITVDGTLEDWVRRLESGNWSGQLEVKKGRVLQWMRSAPIYINTLTAKVESGAIANPEDFSAVLYTLWDDKRFYLAATVVDDEVVTQQEGGDIWQDDAVELWIDCRHDAVTHTLFQEDEFQLGFSPASQQRNHAVGWAWRNPQAEALTQQIEVASVLTSNGYVIEASMPWAAMKGCQPGFGSMVGFNVSMVDKDQDQLWTHITWSGQLHSDPSQFGHLFFLDAPIDLFPSDVFESPSGVSPWQGPEGASTTEPPS